MMIMKIQFLKEGFIIFIMGLEYKMWRDIVIMIWIQYLMVTLIYWNIG